MGYQNQPIGIGDQRITCNPRLLLVRLGKSPVNDHDLSAAFDRIFPVLAFHRNMAVNNVRFFFGQAEFFQNAVHHFLIFQKIVIRILLLLVRLLIRKEIPLKGCHLILAEQRRTFAKPDVPHDILAPFPFLIVQCMESLAHITFQNLIQALPLIRLPIYGHGFQASVLIERHTSMIQKIIVIDLI